MGSKHHVITDAEGVPFAVRLTGANRHDVTQLLPLVDSIPPIAGKVGRPLQHPDSLLGDRAYDSQPHRRKLRSRGIVPLLDNDACTKLAKWFDARWNEKWCIDISNELADIIQESWAREESILPYHIYIKMAYHLAQEARAGISNSPS